MSNHIEKIKLGGELLLTTSQCQWYGKLEDMSRTN